MVLHDGQKESNFTAAGGADTHSSYWWAFIIALIFLALMFLRNDRRDNGYGIENVAAGAMLGNMNNCRNQGGYPMYEWDAMRDNAREFGNLKLEIKETGWMAQKENAHYFYENQKTNLLGFKDVEIQGMRNTSEIKTELSNFKQQMQDERNRELANKVNVLETVLQIRGLGCVPSVPYSHQPYPVPCGTPCAPYGGGYGGY